MKIIESKIIKNGKYKLSTFQDGIWFLCVNDDVGTIIEVYYSLIDMKENIDVDIINYENNQKK